MTCRNETPPTHGLLLDSLSGKRRLIELLGQMAAPRASIATQEAATCVEFSPFEESSDLLAIGSESRITVKACHLQVLNDLYRYPHNYTYINVMSDC